MYLLLDIGGTNIRLATSSDGTSLSSVTILPTPLNFDEGIITLQKLSAQIINKEKIQAVSLGITGILNKNKDGLAKSPHLPNWANKPIKEKLEKLFNAPVFLENDTALVGLGEATKGAGQGFSIVAYITVSTGLGGVRIVDQKIDKNSQGFEPGHQIIIPDGPLCDCGGKGHLETLVAGSYLERIYKQKPQQITDENVWKEVSKYLSIGLNNVIVHWSPDIIVLGGSIMQKLSLDQVKSDVSKYLTIFPEMPEIKSASLKDEGGLYGALWLRSFFKIF